MSFNRAFGRGPEELATFARTPWGRDLLALWRPAGQSAREDGGLRLAARNGTLNFYRCGQSVAKVGFARDRTPYLAIHVAYVTGEKGLGQHYARLSGTQLTCKSYEGSLPAYEGFETLEKWVNYADGYKGDEKDFVDNLVQHNSKVIDLEMGLSGYASKDNKLTAPRIDLVALEEVEGNLQIVFWEAKMMDNSELRSKSTPKILEQLNNYKRWIDQGSNRMDVINAYQENCRLLGELHLLEHFAS